MHSSRAAWSTYLGHHRDGRHPQHTVPRKRLEPATTTLPQQTMTPCEFCETCATDQSTLSRAEPPLRHHSLNSPSNIPQSAPQGGCSQHKTKQRCQRWASGRVQRCRRFLHSIPRPTPSLSLPLSCAQTFCTQVPCATSPTAQGACPRPVHRRLHHHLPHPAAAMGWLPVSWSVSQSFSQDCTKP
jgi:hypothetical protein